MHYIVVGQAEQETEENAVNLPLDHPGSFVQLPQQSKAPCQEQATTAPSDIVIPPAPTNKSSHEYHDFSVNIVNPPMTNSIQMSGTIYLHLSIALIW